MITMTAEEQIQELRAEIAHADDLVDRLVAERDEALMRAEIAEGRLAEVVLVTT